MSFEEPGRGPEGRMRESEFTPEEERLFEFEKVREQTALDRFRGSCMPSRLTPETVALLIALVTGGGVAAERAFAEINASQVETVETSSARIQTAFRNSAEALRKYKADGGHESPYDLEQIADDIENFPVEEVFDQIAELTGLSSEEVAQLNRLTALNVYSEQDISAVERTVSEQVGRKVNTEELDQVQTFALRRAGINFQSSTVLLNLDEMGDGAYDRDVFFDVATHEFMHSFPHKQLDGERRMKNFYEGMTESLANEISGTVFDREPNTDPFEGYVDGGTASAQLLLAATSKQEVYHGYVQGDAKKMSAEFDAKYGEGAFEYAIGIDKAIGEKYAHYDAVAPLLGMMQMMSDSERDSAVERANEHLTTSDIVPVDFGTWTGAILVGEQAPNGINNGAIRLNTPEGTKVLAFATDVGEAGAGINQIAENLAVLYDSPENYNDSGKPFTELSPDEARGVVHKMLEAHADELALLE